MDKKLKEIFEDLFEKYEVNVIIKAKDKNIEESMSVKYIEDLYKGIDPEWMKTFTEALNQKSGSIKKPNESAFQKEATPLMKYLAENHHPHCTAIVSATYAELMEGLESHATDEFLMD